ncbi:hypothetical protein [Singulisphaera acidiphila]|uniref:Uncharacterized protein n=1 Tax=Singulisphaera acidiphila (strain ATCC BAA-1392 / DSM 18658 / VKM B-2454 / MOB10) TaxID=886293 RepID=L0D505_SINAD|nr:hypothetical protein [Singulisphaera acidiphila]AGA24514.1 hypothetical protein Sinac_0052 [Singulisphaera acidiphila DSM 18658]
MQTRPWLEQVWSEVVRSGLPPAYADRLLTELSDHAEELGDQAEQRLGKAEELAGAAVLAYRSSSFAGRHPLAAFVLLPLLLVVAGLGVHAVVVVASLEGLAWAFGQPDHPVVAWAAIASVRLIGYVSPLAVVIGGWAVYRRCGRPLGWFLALALLVAGFAALIVTGFDPLMPAAPVDLFVKLVPPNELHRVAQAALTGAVGLSFAGLDRVRRVRAFATVLS